MFDPQALLSPFQITRHLSFYVAINVTSGCECFAEKTQYVRTAESVHGVIYGVMYEQRIEPSEIFGTGKHYIGRPLTLVSGPIIVNWEIPKDLGVNRIEVACNLTQQMQPVCFELCIHQLLCLIPIRYPGKAVILALIANSSAIHLTSQPLSPIYANLD